MAYVTSQAYSSEILDLASDKIDELTFNRIRSIGFANLTAFQKTKVEAATLKQAEFYDTYGADAESVGSYSVADVSVSFSSTSTYPGVSPAAIMELKQTGLMVRMV